MNDFTKEELQFILLSIKPFHWLWENNQSELENKLQSFIDNYCEHVHSINHAPQAFAAHGARISEWEVRCDKCQRIYYDNQ